MADNEQVFRIVVDYKTAYEELERVKEKLKAAQSETRNLTIKQQELNEQFKQGVISEQEYQSASEALRQKLIANRKEVTALTEERRKAMQIEKSMALAEMAEANSLIQLRETLKTLTKQFDALGEAKQKSAKGVQLQKEIDGVNKKILELEMSTGRFGRNVGNYASGFNPLNFQVQQLTRELPSLTMNLQQFFLAISNNLPMFADELQRAAAANAKLRKEGHATIPVWKQVLSALGSWQTILVVGITLLTAYGKEIGEWVKELFKGEKAFNVATEAQKRFNEAMVQGQVDAQKSLTHLRLLYSVTQDATLSIDGRRKAIEELQKLYPAYFGQLTQEEILTGKAKDAYNQLRISILATAKARAAANILTENNEKEQKIINTPGYEQIERYQRALEKIPKTLDHVPLTQIDSEIQKALSTLEGFDTKIYNEFKGAINFKGDPFDKALDYNNAIRNMESGLKKGVKLFKEANKELYDEINENGANPAQAVEVLRQSNEKLSSEAIKSISEQAPETRLIKGSIAAIEAAKREKEEALKNITNKADYKKLENEIKAHDVQLTAIDGKDRSDKSTAKDAKKEAGVLAKIRFDELKAAQELALSEQNYAAKMNEAILNDENQSYENRMAALEQFTSNKQNVILQGADDEIENLIRNKAKELNLDADNKNDRVKIEKICANQIGVIRDEANTKVLELEETKNKKEIELRDKAAGDMIALMADGSAKEMTKLNLLYNQKVRAAQGNAEKLLAIQKWYEREAAKITPEGKLASGMSEASRTYEMQMDLIDQMEIKEEEKDKKRIEAELTFRKAQAKTFEDYIKGLQTTGQLSEGEYQEMISELGGMYTDIVNLQNQLDGTASEGKGSNFIQKLFGIDTSTKKGKAEWKAKKKEMISQVTDFAKELTSSVIDIQKEASQRRLKLEQERIDAERDSELKSLELRYNKGLMSEKAYNKAVDATNAEADRKKEEAERAAFERDKQLKIKQVMIETALSIAKTFAMYGWPLGIVPAAFAAAEGAVQVAVISAQQYAKGGIIPIGDGKNGVSMGMLQGPSHSQGGIPLMVNGQPVNAEVEGGEILAVINKRSAAQYLPLFSAINATNGVKFENGGVIGSGWSLPTPAPLPPSNGQMLASMRDDLRTYYRQTERMIKATTERIDNIKVHVVEKDITKTQKKVASIRAKATIIGGK